MTKTVQNSGASVDDIVQSVYQLGRTMRKRMLTHDASGLHMGQMHALLFISEKPGITMKELAKALHVASPSATSFIDRLVKLRLVARLSDDSNRRLVRLKLTEAGSKMLKEKMSQRRRMFMELLSTLSASDRESLRVILGKILSHCSS